MVSTFINPVRNSGAGAPSFEEGAPIELLANASEQDVELVIQSVYRQVLGNAHVMESERLVVPESRLRQGEITVREFVRQIAMSPLYYRLFVESRSRTRTIELNFKHLLGRAPSGYAELSLHGQIYDQGGLEAEIESYVDGDEYLTAFGDDTVPYARGYRTMSDQTVSAFNYWSRLLRGAASSDKGQRSNQSQLNTFLMRDQPSGVELVTGLLPPVVALKATSTEVGSVSRALLGSTNSSTGSVFQGLPFSQPRALTPHALAVLDVVRRSQFYSAYAGFNDTDPVELRNGFSDEEVNVVIRAVYRQVLGNAYVMESERLTVPESQVKSGEISVREFVRQVAKSDLYRTRFFDNCYRYRAIELNFKHLLGRAPDNFDEMRYHSAVLDQRTFADEIDSYLDSDEYQSAFGEYIVPYYRGVKSQLGQSMLGFTNLFTLLRSTSSSDKDLMTNQHPRLTRALIQGSPYGKVQLSNANQLISEALNLPEYQAVTPAPQPQPVMLAKDIVTQALGMPEYRVSEVALPCVSDLSRNSQFYSAYQSFKETVPVELCAGFSSEDGEVVIRAVYRQVLGNAYVMESERLTVPESQLKRGEISVREFVRQVAKSELYRCRFFDNCYRYRAIELNFKHLLGRAPDNFDEMREHSGVLDRGTFDNEIDSYLDSDEYQAAFGECIVPYYRGIKSHAGQSMLGFTNLFELLRGASSSDKDLAMNQRPRLTRALIQGSPYGKMQSRDPKQIIAQALNLQPSPVPVQGLSADAVNVQVLQETVQAQGAEIKALEARLAVLRSSAALGAACLQGDYASTVLSGDAGGSQGAADSLPQQVSDQAERIDALNRQIVEAQSLAAIGDYRLNKWRSRTFA